ncbi:MAG: pilus assembly protein PilM, partial [Phycisphaerales bacterium]|nr:pilus assembly protein PilM [Phycisphaerales bacterium]
AVQQIPFPLEEVEWDYQTFVSPDSPEVEVGIFAITRERIMNLLRLLADVGLTPDVVTLAPVAAYNAMAYDLQFTEDTQGTILLDVGTSSTDLIVAEAGRVWVRTFPIGGHQFTQAMAEKFNVSYTKADKLKREADSHKHARQILQSMRPVFSDLAQDVQRSIGFYQSIHRDANLTRLIGLGSTFKLPGLKRYLNQQLGMNVYRIENFKRMHIEGPQEGEFQQYAMNFATAYGLALQGLELATLEANLMPAAILKEAMWRRKTKWFALAAGLAVAASAAMFIRPYLDSVEMRGASEPGEIQSAMRTFNRLRTEATAAGVTESGGSDFFATELIGMYENREIMGYVLADLDALMSNVDGNRYHLTEFATQYLPPQP